MEHLVFLRAAAVANLQLQPVGSCSRDAADQPSDVVYHVTGTPPEDWIHIERLGMEQSLWCVVWYRLAGGQWRRAAMVEGTFQTAAEALESVALAIESQRTRDHGDPSAEFVNGVEGEMNLRFGVLAFLYNRRRTSPRNPGVSVFDLEKRMGVPRERLEFSIWYLKSKQYVAYVENSEIALTALGVDFVEANCSKISVLGNSLDGGRPGATGSNASASGAEAPAKTPPLRESDEERELCA